MADDDVTLADIIERLHHLNASAKRVADTVYYAKAQRRARPVRVRTRDGEPVTIGAMIAQVRKDTRGRKGRGPVKRTTSVLAHRYPGGSLNPGMVIFQEHRGDQIATRSILIERDALHDMGNPDIVTITVEPGDTIN